MIKTFSIIGGDLRIIKLAKMLANETNIVYTYGLERSQELKENNNIKICKNLKEAVQNSQIIIAPIPFSSDGINVNTPNSTEIIKIDDLLTEIKTKLLIAGSIKPEIYKQSKDVKIIDIMKREDLAVLNAIATAEGAIQSMIENTDKILQGSNVLILGFGRISKVLAQKLKGLSVQVTCAARKSEDLAWIKTYGYTPANINNLGNNLKEYDIIVNTVPHILLTDQKLNHIKPECLLIDLASKPGGIDTNYVKEKNLNYKWLLALPGKVAPVTSAEFIKETIYNILKEG